VTPAIENDPGDVAPRIEAARREHVGHLLVERSLVLRERSAEQLRALSASLLCLVVRLHRGKGTEELIRNRHLATRNCTCRGAETPKCLGPEWRARSNGKLGSTHARPFHSLDHHIPLNRMRSFRSGKLTSLLCAVLLTACASEKLSAPPTQAIIPEIQRRLADAHYSGAVAVRTVLQTDRISQQFLGESHDPPHAADISIAGIGGPRFDLTSGLNFIRPPNGGIYTLNATPWIDYKLNFYCYQGGELIGLIKNVEVTLIEQIPEGGGGHLGSHTGLKPVGQNDPAFGVTDAAGDFVSRYTSGPVSGDERSDVSYVVHDPTSPCDGETGVKTYYNATRWDGLVRLVPSSTLGLCCLTSDHADIYYVQPNIVQLAQLTGDHFVHQVAGSPALQVSAASLIYGGLEDIYGNWKPPHFEHRIGTDLDLAGPNTKHKTLMRIKDAGQRAGFPDCHPESAGTPNAHTHCRFHLYN